MGRCESAVRYPRDKTGVPRDKTGVSAETASGQLFEERKKLVWQADA